MSYCAGWKVRSYVSSLTLKYRLSSYFSTFFNILIDLPASDVRDLRSETSLSCSDGLTHFLAGTLHCDARISDHKRQVARRLRTTQRRAHVHRFDLAQVREISRFRTATQRDVRWNGTVRAMKLVFVRFHSKSWISCERSKKKNYNLLPSRMALEGLQNYHISSWFRY